MSDMETDAGRKLTDQIDGLYRQVDELRNQALQRLDRVIRFHSSDAAAQPKCRACHQTHPCHTRLLAQGREQ